MSKLKTNLIIILLLLFIGLGISVLILNKRLEKTQNELCIAVNNNKAYEAETDSLNKRNIQYQLTVDQLKYSNDSIIKKLNSTRKKLKIKDKQIQELEYIASLNQKKDTLVIRDTIFQKSVNIDTTIKDNWNTLRLQLLYPNTIITDCSFKNETVVATSIKKVTVKPPKKCAFARWFQKKQKIIEIEVIQLNPYCINQNYKSVKVIK